MEEFNVAIIGSRNFTDYLVVSKALHAFRKNSIIKIIVSGGAKGADSLGEIFAENNGIDTMIFKPDWNQHGKAAGFIRNKDIIDNVDVVFAFWDMESKGTKHSIDMTIKQNKILFIYNFINKKWSKHKYE